jgi:hypothetical protein
MVHSSSSLDCGSGLTGRKTESAAQLVFAFVCAGARLDVVLVDETEISATPGVDQYSISLPSSWGYAANRGTVLEVEMQSCVS